MQSLIAGAGLAPVFREPSLRSEQVTQLVLGETALVVDTTGEWCRIRVRFDGYEGWVHRGYCLVMSSEDASRWHDSARGWSDGAVVNVAGQIVRLPVRARVRIDGDGVILPGGRRGRVIAGRVASEETTFHEARRVSPERWAATTFAGTRYEWGGVSTWGVDCSGLVQTTFAARGLVLPRDASQQAGVGRPVQSIDVCPGDLLFFRDDGERITHVGLAGAGQTIVHSTVSCGGLVVESWAPGSRAAGLWEHLVAVRRLTAAGT
jgi:hypothetical protein